MASSLSQYSSGQGLPLDVGAVRVIVPRGFGRGHTVGLGLIGMNPNTGLVAANAIVQSRSDADSLMWFHYTAPELDFPEMTTVASTNDDDLRVEATRSFGGPVGNAGVFSRGIWQVTLRGQRLSDWFEMRADTSAAGPTTPYSMISLEPGANHMKMLPGGNPVAAGRTLMFYKGNYPEDIATSNVTAETAVWTSHVQQLQLPAAQREFQLLSWRDEDIVAWVRAGTFTVRAVINTVSKLDEVRGTVPATAYEYVTKEVVVSQESPIISDLVGQPPGGYPTTGAGEVLGLALPFRSLTSQDEKGVLALFGNDCDEANFDDGARRCHGRVLNLVLSQQSSIANPQPAVYTGAAMTGVTMEPDTTPGSGAASRFIVDGTSTSVFIRESCELFYGGTPDLEDLCFFWVRVPPGQGRDVSVRVYAGT